MFCYKKLSKQNINCNYQPTNYALYFKKNKSKLKQMKKTTIYVLLGMLAITTSCKEEADQKKVLKEVMVIDSVYDPEAALAKMGIELKTPTAPVANYVNLVSSVNLIFLSGKGPSKEDGSYITNNK